MSWIKKHDKGTLINLYIQPGASKSELAGIHGDRLKVKIKAPPREGEANESLIEFIAEVLGISKAKVHLIRGKASRQKDLLVEVPEALVEKKLTFSIT